MEQLLSPKQVARAIDVSESSLKRWCDQGLIRTIRTAGGHRRLPISAVMEFLRQGEHRLVRPEVLGLPATSGQSSRVIERAQANMLAALLAGDQQQCRQLLIDLFLAKHSIATIGDQVIAPAFKQIGDYWECGEAEIYQERRACEIVMRGVLELAEMLPVTDPAAPCALGAAAWSDHYQLPTLLVEMTFRSHGWRAISLGSRLPADTLCTAVESIQPEAFWLSVSHMENSDDFIQQFNRFQETVGEQTQVIIGGQALTPEIRPELKSVPFCETLADLEEHLDTVSPSAATPE